MIKDSSEEIWRPVVGYEEFYEVSSIGKVRSLRDNTRIVDETNRIMKQKFDNKGYLRVNLHKNGKSKSEIVSRLVAKAFIENPNGLKEVGHDNDIKTDNRVGNLYWTDSKENNHHNGKYERFYKLHCEKMDIIVDKISTPVIGTNKVTGEETYFKSIQEAKKAINNRAAKISECCAGKRKSAQGYYWRKA